MRLQGFFLTVSIESIVAVGKHAAEKNKVSFTEVVELTDKTTIVGSKIQVLNYMNCISSSLRLRRIFFCFEVAKYLTDYLMSNSFGICQPTILKNSLCNFNSSISDH